MNAHVKHVILKALSAMNGNKRGKVVFYHDVYKTKSQCRTPTPLELFRNQIDYANAKGWHPVPDMPRGDREFQIQFDDGFRGVYECREELLEMGVYPTVNLSMAQIGTDGYLTKNEICTLHKLGFRFQSHTWNHIWLPQCSDVQLQHELVDSRNWLMDLLQVEVSQICFPRGLFSHRVYTQSIDAGYSILSTCIPGAYDEGLMPLLLPRQIVQSVSPEDFVLILNGALCLIKRHYFSRQFVKNK